MKTYTLEEVKKAFLHTFKDGNEIYFDASSIPYWKDELIDNLNKIDELEDIDYEDFDPYAEGQVDLLYSYDSSHLNKVLNSNLGYVIMSPAVFETEIKLEHAKGLTVGGKAYWKHTGPTPYDGHVTGEETNMFLGYITGLCYTNNSKNGSHCLIRITYNPTDSPNLGIVNGNIRSLKDLHG